MSPLLRRPTLWLTGQPWFRHLVADSPIGRSVARRFVAGEDLDDAMRTAGVLAERRVASILNRIGENASTPAQAALATDAYVRALKRIRELPQLDCCISVKPTQLGLDSSHEAWLENLEQVLQAAASADRSILVMIDMEASASVGRTLEAYLDLRGRFPNVGVCLRQTFAGRRPTSNGSADRDRSSAW